ncbi:MAG: FecR family protein [Lutibacter sp.]|nr:FecR family protein [Lutibacter sp.]
MEKNYFLAKWLNGEITEETLKEHVSEEEIRAYKKIISATNQLEAPSYNAQESLEKIKKTHAKTAVKKLKFTKYFYRIAAVFAVLITSYYFISTKDTSYTTNLAEKITFELPDQSEVHLNADSKITFNAKNWKKNRTLNLKGEAYFRVKKGNKFTVNSDLGSVQVLGTKFNVIERDQYFEVNCYEGLVSVTSKIETVKVPAGSSYKILNKVSQFSKNTSEIMPAWLQNSSSFKSMPYKYVVKELERQYNISIEYDVKYENNLFTGSFIHSNLELALQAISIPLNLKYEIISDKKVYLKLDEN